ncbi:MAG: hypothetical protein KatS3mg008_0520 [Acidimicrobiales bacterium]|nr:MAG: hypothetical protein KatS3mg008_0520 [Acidimicrobiales bacterium]
MSEETPSLASQEDLAKLIEGLSDDEITTAVKNMGVDQVLSQIAQAMTERFNPNKAGNQSAVVQWDVNVDDETKSFHLVIENGTCTANMGTAESPRVTLAFSLPSFIKFIAGKLDGMQAFMTGQLRLTGDMMFAQQMQAWFDQG